MTSGASLPVLPDDVPPIVDLLAEMGADGASGFARLGREDLERLTTRILRRLVRSGVTDFVGYVDPGVEPSENPRSVRFRPPEADFDFEPERAAFSGHDRSRHERSVIELPRRVARNAPCPCGSGRKFKKCCGP